MPNIKQIIKYILVLVVLSILLLAAIFSITKQNPQAIVSIYGYLFIPALSAVIARALSGEQLKKGGLKLGSLKNIALAWTIGVGAALFTFFAPIFLGVGTIDPSYSKFTELISQVGGTIPENPPQFFALMSIMSLTVFIFPAAILAFGEEFGFRGYLLQKLLKLGRFKALFITGLIWGIWRIPLYSLTESLSLLNISSLLMVALLLGTILGWLYLRSMSIWVPALASAAYQTSQAIYSLITDIAPEIIEISGILVLALFCIVLYFSGELENIEAS